MRVPEWVAELKQHMIEELGAILHKGWEADDAVVYLRLSILRIIYYVLSIRMY